MIENLKAEALVNEHDQLAGEIVTREDGSQVVRVRKRKRRSSQPDKEAEMRLRKRKLIAVACVFGIGFLGGLVAVCSLAYHNSNAYQEKLIGRISGGSGAGVKLDGLRVSVSTASAKSLQMQWPDGAGIIEQLELNQLAAMHGVGGFFGSEWLLPEVTSQSGRMILRQTDAPALPADRVSVQDITVGSYRCSKLDVYWQGETKPWLKELQLSFVPESEGDKFTVLHGYFGDRQLEQFRISNGVMRLHQNAAELGLYLDHEKSSGSVRLAGEMPYALGKEAEFEMHITRLPLRVLVGDAMGSLFEGNMDSGHAKLWYQRGKENGVRLDAELTSELISLAGFSFLTDLSSLFNKQWYNRPVFDESGSMNLQRKGNALSITKLALEAKGQLKVTGEIHTDQAGNLRGKLMVGVPLALKPILVEKLEVKAFTEAHGGYLWQEVILSGSVNAPEDDLNQLLMKVKPTHRPTAPEPEREDTERPLDTQSLQEKEFEELTK